MIIPVNPSPDDFGLDDLTCHAAGETPKYCYAAFAGIQKGDDWVPGDKDPPNNIYELEQVVAHIWRFTEDNFTFHYQSCALNAILYIAYSPIRFVFEDEPGGNCILYFQNGLVLPAGNKYYGGFGMVSWIPLTAAQSIALMAQHWGIPLSEFTTFLSYPMSYDAHVVKFQTPDKNVKVSILYDYS